MWTIDYTRSGKSFTASYTSDSGLYTDSPSLEILFLSRATSDTVLLATPTGPSEPYSDQPYLAYALVGQILFDDLGVKDWNTEGTGTEWPLDEDLTEAEAVFSDTEPFSAHTETFKDGRGNIHYLIDWYENGAGADRIRWGEEGDFTRCMAIAGKYIEDSGGFCQERHKSIFGESNAEHDKRLGQTAKAKAKVSLYVDYLRNKFSNPCHSPETGQFCTTSGAIQSVKLTATIQKTLNKDLDAQGLPANSPIRGVIDHRGSKLAVARDPQGQITGAIAYDNDKDQISTQDFRVLDEKKGTGTRIMQHLAQEALTTKDKAIVLYGAVQDAVPFYQKMGAEFRRQRVDSSPGAAFRWSSTGQIEGSALEDLAKGVPTDRRIDINDDDKFDDNGYLTASGEEEEVIPLVTHHIEEDEYGFSVKEKDSASRYVDYLRSRTILEFANPCHNKSDGRFCETHGTTHTNIGTGPKVVGPLLSTSVPTAVKSGYKAGDVARMGLGLVTDDALPAVIDRQGEVPGFEDLVGRTDRRTLTTIVERQAQNIEDTFDQAYSIGTDTANAHAGWYPYVNEWAHDQAAATGLAPEGIMAAAAVLSPSADWANNVAWSKATAEYVANEKNIIVQPEWIAAQHMAALASHDFKIKKHAQTNAKRIAAGEEPKEFKIAPPGDSKHTGLVGKKVSELSSEDAAVVLRGAHEAYGKAIHQLGGSAGLGNPKNIATPQTINNFAKAISVLRNPSPENIDTQLGKSHKVRSFFANMRDPHNTTQAEVTVDSHHLGVANGIPLAGAHPLVARIYDGPKAATTGLVGTYPLVVEATRLATSRINKKYGTNYTPNQVQSITWEAHRQLYPSDKRTPSLVSKIGVHRAAFRRGSISRNEMRARIENDRLGAGGPTLVKIRERFLDELGKAA